MSRDGDLGRLLREYVSNEPALGLTFESIVAAGRRNRRRRRMVGASCLAAGALAAGSIGVYAVDRGSSPSGRGPEVVQSSSEPPAPPWTDADERAEYFEWFDSIMSRPLTAEERRIGDSLVATMESYLPESALVTFKRSRHIWEGGEYTPPYVALDVRIETDHVTRIAFHSWARNTIDYGEPDLSVCAGPSTFCDETEAGQVLVGSDVSFDGATAGADVRAMFYGPETKLLTFEPFDGWVPEPLWTLEQLAQIVSDPDLLMREGTEGVDPRAEWRSPEEISDLR